MNDISTFPKFHVYCDESSQTKLRYTVIGALFCTASSAPNISEVAREAAHAQVPSSEYKWSKVRDSNLRAYKAIVDVFFEYHKKNSIHFYAIVVENHTVNNHVHNDGDRDLGFTKFLFTLIYKFARVYRGQKQIYTFLDDRTTRHAPEPMRIMLNQRCRRDLNLDYDPYRLVQFVKSEKSMLIQMTDIITGAIAYETNSHHIAANAARSKQELWRHVLDAAGMRSLAKPTPPGAKRPFDIWHLDFSKGKQMPRT